MTVPPPPIDRRRATRLNLFFQYASIGLTVIQGFVLVPYYLAYIDAATFGAWLATGNVVAWLAIIDPGFSAVLQQRVARLLGEGALEPLAHTIGTGVVLALGIAILFAGSGLAIAPFVGRFAGLGVASTPVVAQAFALACIAEAVLLLDLAVAAVLIGLMTRIVWTGSIYLACTILGVLATLLLLHAGFGLLCIPLGLLLRSLLLLLFHAVLLLKVLRGDLRILPRVSRAELRAVMSVSAFTWAARLATSVVGNMDALLVARYFGPSAVTGFVLTKRASEVLGMVVSRVGAAFTPALAHAWGAGGGQAVRGVASRLLRLALWCGSFGLAGYAGLNREFVSLWVGPSLFGGLTLTVLFGLAAAALAFESIATSILFSVDGARASSAATALSAICRFALTLLLLEAGAGTWSIPFAAAIVSAGLSVGFTLRFLASRVAPGSPDLSRGLLRTFAEGAPLLALGLTWSRWLAPLSSGSWTAFVIGASALGGGLIVFLAAVSPGFLEELRAGRNQVRPSA